MKAFELYDQKFESWNWNQRNLFWRQVIGFTQRFLPANIAMVFAYSLYDVVDNQEKAPRNFKFRYGGGAFFPLIFDSLSGLGYEYAAGDRCPPTIAGAAAAPRLVFFKTYVKQKLQTYNTYAATSKTENLRDCVK